MKKKLGRPVLENPTTQISWRIPVDVFQLLEKRQREIENQTGSRLSLSKVLEGVVRKSIN